MECTKPGCREKALPRSNYCREHSLQSTSHQRLQVDTEDDERDEPQGSFAGPTQDPRRKGR